MNIAALSVRNGPFMLVLFGLLIALGFSSLQSIPRSEDPYFPISAFRIVTVYPGADSLVIERQISEPIEDAITELDNVKKLTSTSSDSLSVVFVEFDATVDVDKKYDEVSREINALRSSLPDGVARQEIDKINPGLVQIVQLGLVSETASYARLADEAEALQDELERIPGVRQSETWAYPKRELRVALDYQRLAELKLRAGDVLAAVAGENTNVPGGAIESGPRRYNLQTSGSYTDLDEVRETVVGGSPGRLIRIKDIATVSWDYEAREVEARLNGQRAVWVTANQKDGQNIAITQAAIDETVEAFKARLPSDIKLVPTFKQSKNVEERLSRLTTDLAIAIALVVITLLPLGLRAAGVVMISIPLSLATGLAALHFAGFSLNQLSIAGFVVALGLLVDDSIVVTENIARFMREGHSRMQAAILGTRQIALAVLGCTATLLFAFLPLLLLPGNSGKYIRSLPVAVVFTVTASLFISLTIIPYLASRLLPRHEKEEGNAALRLTMSAIHTIYAPLLNRALAAPKRVMLISGVVVALSVMLIPSIGFSLFPKAETPQFLIQARLPVGASLQESDRVVRAIESALASEKEVEHFMATIGRGNPQIYYNLFSREPAAHYAEVFVQLYRYDPETTPALYARLRSRFDDIAGAEVLLKEFENGPPIDAPIALRLVGPDLTVLRDLANELERLMASTPGARDVINPLRRGKIDLQLAPNVAQAGLLGVQPVELDQNIRLAVSGLEAGDFRTADGDNYPVVLRAPMQGRGTLEVLQGLHVASSTGEQIPLAQLAAVELVQSPPSISRYGRSRSVTVTAYPQAGFNTAAVTSAIVKRLEQMNLPPGYRFEIGGEAESQAESLSGFGTAILLTVFGITAVLVLEFGSFKSTLIVATVIPLGITGGLLALFFTGNSISFTAMIGFIALVGIEIKNSILLVDFTNQLRAEGLPLDDAIAKAGEVRFLPILLTSLTAVGGLLPLAVQNSGIYSPLAWVIIGGLTSSTLLGRLVTPVLYKLLPPNQTDDLDAAIETRMPTSLRS